MQQRTRISVLLGTGIVAAALLTGCSSGGDGTPTATATATETVTASPSSEPSSTASSPAASASSPASAPSASGGGGSACAATSLAGSIEAGSGGAAGSTYVHLVLRNTGTATCTLQGWPGVSFVGDTDGTQLGNAAKLDRASAHPTVTLAAGQQAVAPLQITNAQNYPAGQCDPVSPDGFRVYPPGSKQSLFVAATEYTACRSTDVSVLTVQGLVPEGQAAD
jgi:hypothetical protein